MLVRDILIRQKGNKKVAVKYGNESVTYEGLYQQSKLLSDKLASINTKSNKIGILLPNSIFYVIGYFGITLIDRIIVPISPQSKFEEILRTIDHCDIDILITNSDFQNVFETNKSDIVYKINLFNVENQTIIEYGTKEVNGSLSIDSTKEDDVALMLPTSGSTNFPKRVMLSHKNLISNIKSNIVSLQLTKEDVVLISLPMNFGYCNTAQFLTHMYLGATIIIMNQVFIPQMFLKIVDREKVTNFTGVPTMLLMLLKCPISSTLDISSLRYICFGGGVMPLDKLRELMSKYPNTGFIQTYGQTEASPRLTALLPEHSYSKLGSVGLPVPNVQLRIVDEAGVDVLGNQLGEVIAKGDNIMKGYYKNDSETNKVLRNGWLYTGDIGYRDDDGFLYLVGRKRNIIISGGINIYPEEIEGIIVSHPEIDTAIVVGEEHELLGEIPVAKVVVNRDSNISENELVEYCMSKLPNYKVPKKIHFVEELSKTSNGKVKRYN